MKLTLQLRNFFDMQCKQYCDQIGLSEVPLIIYTDDELRETECLSETEIRRIKKEELGRSWSKGVLPKIDRDLFYLNVENTDFLWQLLDTVVHELVHLRFINDKHGNDFQDKVNRIIVGERF